MEHQRTLSALNPALYVHYMDSCKESTPEHVTLKRPTETGNLTKSESESGGHYNKKRVDTELPYVSQTSSSIVTNIEDADQQIMHNDAIQIHGQVDELDEGSLLSDDNLIYNIILKCRYNQPLLPIIVPKCVPNDIREKWSVPLCRSIQSRTLHKYTFRKAEKFLRNFKKNEEIYYSNSSQIISSMTYRIQTPVSTKTFVNIARNILLSNKSKSEIDDPGTYCRTMASEHHTFINGVSVVEKHDRKDQRIKEVNTENSQCCSVFPNKKKGSHRVFYKIEMTKILSRLCNNKFKYNKWYVEAAPRSMNHLHSKEYNSAVNEPCTSLGNSAHSTRNSTKSNTNLVYKVPDEYGSIHCQAFFSPRCSSRPIKYIPSIGFVNLNYEPKSRVLQLIANTKVDKGRKYRTVRLREHALKATYCSSLSIGLNRHKLRCFFFTALYNLRDGYTYYITLPSSKLRPCFWKYCPKFRRCFPKYLGPRSKFLIPSNRPISRKRLYGEIYRLKCLLKHGMRDFRTGPGSIQELIDKIQAIPNNNTSVKGLRFVKNIKVPKSMETLVARIQRGVHEMIKYKKGKEIEPSCQLAKNLHDKWIDKYLRIFAKEHIGPIMFDVRMKDEERKEVFNLIKIEKQSGKDTLTPDTNLNCINDEEVVTCVNNIIEKIQVTYQISICCRARNCLLGDWTLSEGCFKRQAHEKCECSGDTNMMLEHMKDSTACLFAAKPLARHCISKSMWEFDLYDQGEDVTDKTLRITMSPALCMATPFHENYCSDDDVDDDTEEMSDYSKFKPNRSMDLSQLCYVPEFRQAAIEEIEQVDHYVKEIYKNIGERYLPGIYKYFFASYNFNFMTIEAILNAAHKLNKISPMFIVDEDLESEDGGDFYLSGLRISSCLSSKMKKVNEETENIVFQHYTHLLQYMGVLTEGTPIWEQDGSHMLLEGLYKQHYKKIPPFVGIHCQRFSPSHVNTLQQLQIRNYQHSKNSTRLKLGAIPKLKIPEIQSGSKINFLNKLKLHEDVVETDLERRFQTVESPEKSNFIDREAVKISETDISNSLSYLSMMTPHRERHGIKPSPNMERTTPKHSDEIDTAVLIIPPHNILQDYIILKIPRKYFNADIFYRWVHSPKAHIIEIVLPHKVPRTVNTNIYDTELSRRSETYSCDQENMDVHMHPYDLEERQLHPPTNIRYDDSNTSDISIYLVDKCSMLHEIPCPSETFQQIPKQAGIFSQEISPRTLGRPRSHKILSRPSNIVTFPSSTSIDRLSESSSLEFQLPYKPKNKRLAPHFGDEEKYDGDGEFSSSSEITCDSFEFSSGEVISPWSTGLYNKKFDFEYPPPFPLVRPIVRGNPKKRVPKNLCECLCPCVYYMSDSNTWYRKELPPRYITIRPSFTMSGILTACLRGKLPNAVCKEGIKVKQPIYSSEDEEEEEKEDEESMIKNTVNPKDKMINGTSKGEETTITLISKEDELQCPSLSEIQPRSMNFNIASVPENSNTSRHVFTKNEIEDIWAANQFKRKKSSSSEDSPKGKGSFTSVTIKKKKEKDEPEPTVIKKFRNIFKKLYKFCRHNSDVVHHTLFPPKYQKNDSTVKGRPNDDKRPVHIPLVKTPQNSNMDVQVAEVQKRLAKNHTAPCDRDIIPWKKPKKEWKKIFKRHKYHELVEIGQELILTEESLRKLQIIKWFRKLRLKRILMYQERNLMKVKCMNEMQHEYLNESENVHLLKRDRHIAEEESENAYQRMLRYYRGNEQDVEADSEGIDDFVVNKIINMALGFYRSRMTFRENYFCETNDVQKVITDSKYSPMTKDEILSCLTTGLNVDPPSYTKSYFLRLEIPIPAENTLPDILHSDGAIFKRSEIGQGEAHNCARMQMK